MTQGRVWRVVGSRNHLSQETLEYLARFGELERGEIELVSMGSSLKFCIIAEGRPSFTRGSHRPASGIRGCSGGTGRGGGSVTQLDGSPLCYNKPDILNPWFVARA